MTTQFQMQMDAPAILQHEARKKFEKEQQMKQEQEEDEQYQDDNNNNRQQKWKPKEKQSDDKDKQMDKDNKQFNDKDKNFGDKDQKLGKEKQPPQKTAEIYEKDVQIGDKDKLFGKQSKQQQQEYVQIPNQGQKKNQAGTQTQQQGSSLLGEEQKDQTQDQKKAKAAATNTESKTNEDMTDTTNIDDNQQQSDGSKVEQLDFSNLLNIVMSLFMIFKRQMFWRPLGFVSKTLIGKRMFPEGTYYDKYFKPVVQLFTFGSRWKLFFVDKILQGMKELASNTMDSYLLPPIKEHMHKLRQVDGMFAFLRYIFDVSLDLFVFMCLFPLIVLASILFSGVWMYRQYLKYKKGIFGLFF